MLSSVRHLLHRYLIDPHWRTIKVYGQAKVLGISATTIIVAPLLSRILIKLNEMEATIRQAHPALNALFPLLKYHFELPLSIRLLVGSAVCALLGKGIYEVTCPSYTKVGNTYEEFRHSQARATATLVTSFAKIARDDDEKKRRAMMLGLQAHQVSFKGTQLNPAEPLEGKTPVTFVVDGRITRSGGLSFVLNHSDVGGPVFYVLRDLMDDSRRAARVTCAFLYLVAFALLSLSLLMQLGWAVRGMLL
jgi:hypothetical protein